MGATREPATGTVGDVLDERLLPGTPLRDCGDVPVYRSSLRGDLSAREFPRRSTRRAIRQYGRDHPDSFGGTWIDRASGGVLVIGFTDDVEHHRHQIGALLDDPGVVVDVVEVEFTERELRTVSKSVFSLMQSLIGEVSSSWNTTDSASNRVHLGFEDPSPAALEAARTQLPAAAACISVTSVPPATDGPVAVIPDLAAQDPLVTCFGLPPFPLSALTERTSIETASHPAIDALHEELRHDSTPRLPTDGWFVLELSEETAGFAAGEPDDLATVTMRVSGDDWYPTNWGTGACDMAVVLPTGLTKVTAHLDPDAAPQPSDTTVQLLLSRSCGYELEGGTDPTGSQLIETESHVLVAFVTAGNMGSRACAGTPVPVTLTLDEPLGDRVIADGLVVPPVVIAEGPFVRGGG